MPKCGIGTPKNQYHNFNTMFSIPRFQYHIFNTTWYSSKMRQFHEKIRQIKDSVAELSFWRVFSWKRFWHQKIPLWILIVNHMIIKNTEMYWQVLTSTYINPYYFIQFLQNCINSSRLTAITYHFRSFYR